MEAFVEFDRTLTERDVVRELRVIAGKEATDDVVDHEEVDNLCQEAIMPIEAVMAKNGSNETTDGTEVKEEPTNAGGSGSNSNVLMSRFRNRNGAEKKPISPFLRAKPSEKNVKTEVRCLCFCNARTMK